MNTLIRYGLAVAIMAILGSPVPAQQPAVRIGALFNVTGGMASIDGPGLNGMKLAATEINASGGALAATRGFEGVTGTISYTSGNRVPRKSVTIIRVMKGVLAFAAEVSP